MKKEEISNDILLKCKKGDTEAFRTVIRQYKGFVLSVVYRFLAGKYSEELENMAQDIFIKIFSFTKSYEPGKGVKFSACVYNIVRSYCFNELRIKRLEAEPAGGFDVYGGVEDIENGILAGELLQRFEKCIETLPDDQRMIIILKEYEKLSYETIGECLNLPVNIIKMKFNRIKVKLKGLLWPYLKEDHGKTL